MEQNIGRDGPKPDRRPKAVSRFHRGKLGPASKGIKGVFQHVLLVAETAAMVSRQTGITDTHTIDTMMYHMVKSDRVKADATQAAIKTGVAAMKAARTIGKDTEPEFKVPTIKLNNKCWRLNRVADGYVATANIGSGKHPVCMAINVPASVARRVLECRLGELTITPEKYVISYTKAVEPMPERDPSLGDTYTVSELASGVDRVAGPPRNVLGTDINATNTTTTSGSTTFWIDTSSEVEEVVNAKTRQVEAAKRDHARWEAKKGRPITRAKEEAREGAQRVRRGGPKKHNKLKRDSRGVERRRDEKKGEITKLEKEALAEPRKAWRKGIRDAKGNPEKQEAIKAERKAVTKELKAETRRLKKDADYKCRQELGRLKREMKRCIAPQNQKSDDGASPLQKQAQNNAKMRGAARASRNLENTLHLVSLFIVSWAAATGSVIALEDLRNMASGWMRENKRFGRGMRRRLYSAAMLKLSDMIHYKARWAGVWAIYMNPRNTSKLCAACRYALEGRDYHLRYCRRCNVCVDRDVNAPHNVRRTTAAALFGPAVRARPDEAVRSPVKKLCYGDLRNDGMSIMADGKIVWVGR